MTQPNEWSIVLYTDARGVEPVRQFLLGLDVRTQERLGWSLEQLRLQNVRARGPLVRHLQGKLWELREESRTKIYRLLYVFLSGRWIVILHGFQKKTQRTPPGEIDVAMRRLSDFMVREEGS